jgi:hypothetical protein
LIVHQCGAIRVPGGARRALLDIPRSADAFGGEHIVVVIVPLAGRPARRCVFEDEIFLLHREPL